MTSFQIPPRLNCTVGGKQAASLPQQQQQLEQRIAYTDEVINKKVYALYGLSEEEVGVVERK